MKLLKRNKLFLGVVLALSVSASTAFAGPLAFTVYTDYSLWFAATSGHQFDHDTFGPAQSLGELAVSTTTGSFGSPRGVFPAGTNVWNDRVTVDGAEVTSFFDGDNDARIPYYAFGGYWDFSPAGDATGLTLLLTNGLSFTICGDGGLPCAGATLVPDGTFFGVVTDPITDPFTALTILANGPPGSMETFDLSHLDMVHTPEPATMVLLGTGFLALMWRKRTSA